MMGGCSRRVFHCESTSQFETTISRHSSMSRHSSLWFCLLDSGFCTKFHFFVRLGKSSLRPDPRVLEVSARGLSTGYRRRSPHGLLASRSMVSRLCLDRPEHGGALIVIGMTLPRGAHYRGTRNSCHNLVSGRSIKLTWRRHGGCRKMQEAQAALPRIPWVDETCVD
jgi:hypothetical protein